jgi:hypothetical protein
MNNNVVIEAHFLPSLEYFCALHDFNEIIIERHERFVKQSYRNRCYIQTTQRVEMLSVPLTAKHHQSLFRDIRVDNSRAWAVGMWRTIMSAYRSSPFYEHYADELQTLLSQKYEFVYDLDLQLLSFCLRALHWDKKISETTEYNDKPLQGYDLRSRIIDRGNFKIRHIYKPVPYYQVFGHGFAENLSLIDLLFCKGPGATATLFASKSDRLNK